MQLAIATIVAATFTTITTALVLSVTIAITLQYQLTISTGSTRPPDSFSKEVIAVLTIQPILHLLLLQISSLRVQSIIVI